jgi:hypothetical protein
MTEQKFWCARPAVSHARLRLPFRQNLRVLVSSRSKVPLSLLLAASLLGSAVAAPPKNDLGLEVLVSADAINSPEGFRPKPGKPVPYLFIQTRASLGEIVAGVKLPPAEVVESTVVAELARQGFVRTQDGGPRPQIILLVIVGAANFQEPPTDVFHPDQDPDLRPYLDRVNLREIVQKNLIGTLASSPTLESIFDETRRSMDVVQIQEQVVAEAQRLREKESPRGKDKARIQALIGAPKIMAGVDAGSLDRSESARLASAAKEDRYYISVQAFDAARWTRKERLLLWRTTMLIDARRDFARELATMLARGGPSFGTDVALPEFRDNRHERKADVEIGETRVVPDTSSPPPPEKKK